MSDLSVRLSCLLYTLQGKSVKENKYVDIFLIWLTYVCKYAGLRPIDCLQIVIDETTCDALVQHNQTLQILLEEFKCEVVFIKVPQPKTHGEGMMNRFIYTEQIQDIFMYCDIDVLFQKPICNLVTNIEDNTIAVHVEGLLSDNNYGGAFPREFIETNGDKCNGFSSGKFIIRGRGLHILLFQTLSELKKTHNPDAFYCPDQVMYNLAIYELHNSFPFSVNTTIFKRPVICTNILGDLPEETVLADYMGEPGNANLHFEKLLSLLIYGFLQSKP